MASTPQYIFSLDVACQLPTKKRNTTYGTVIYLPENYHIDMGTNSPWPRQPIRDKCPRIILQSTWTDHKWGFPGGGMNSGESPLETLHREFYEEVGIHVDFSIQDYRFSCYDSSDGGKISHMFCKLTNDLAYFQNILSSFEQFSTREAYVNEVYAVSGMPLFFQGDNLPVSSTNMIVGLPRYLNDNGGAFTPTLAKTNVVRETFLVLVLHLRLMDLPTMKRCLALANQLGSPPILLSQLLQLSGIAEMLDPLQQ